jgi:uncharacterized protein YdiU (UPF0061 family)
LAEERMRLANPKYILREQTLVETYGKAANGDESMIKELLDLVEHPYDEGTDEQFVLLFLRLKQHKCPFGPEISVGIELHIINS